MLRKIGSFVGMLLLAVVSLCLGLLSARFGAQASAGLARNLRQAMFEKIQTYSFSNIDKFSTSSLITRLTTDVTNVQNAYMMILRMCSRAPASLLVAMVLSFSINASWPVSTWWRWWCWACCSSSS